MWAAGEMVVVESSFDAKRGTVTSAAGDIKVEEEEGALVVDFAGRGQVVVTDVKRRAGADRACRLAATLPRTSESLANDHHCLPSSCPAHIRSAMQVYTHVPP